MATWEEIAAGVREAFEGKSAPKGGTARGPAVPPLEDWEAQTLEDLSRQFAAQEKNYKQPTIPAASGWNMPLQVGNALSLGTLPTIAPQVLSPSGMQALGLPSGGPPANPQVPGKVPSDQAQISHAIDTARAGWEQENPGLAMAGTALGAAPWAFAGASPGAALAETLPARLPGWLRSATSGALQGGGAALATSPLSDRPLGEQVLTGAAFGGLMNPLSQGARGLFGMTSHITPGVAASAEGLRDAGVPLRPGQLPGAAPALRLVDRLFGRGSTEEARGAAVAKLTDFAGRNDHGYPASNPTPTISQGWVDSNKKRIGDVMETIAKNNTFVPDQKLVSDTGAFLAKAKASLPAESYKRVYDAVDRVVQDLQPGGTPGSIYHGWTKLGGTLHNFAESKDPGVSNAVNEFKRGVLEPAWERSLPAGEFPAWQQAKQQYRLNERLNDSFDATSGEFNFKKFLSKVESEYGSFTNANKAIPGMGDLAAGGPLLQEGGGHGLYLHHPLTRLGATALGAGVLGSYFHDPIMRGAHMLMEEPSTIMGPVAALAAGAYGGGRVANRLFNSPSALERMIFAGAQAERRGATSGSPRMFHGVNPLLWGSQATAPGWMRPEQWPREEQPIQ